jgi:hypothetical protein
MKNDAKVALTVIGVSFGILVYNVLSYNFGETKVDKTDFVCSIFALKINHKTVDKPGFPGFSFVWCISICLYY